MLFRSAVLLFLVCLSTVQLAGAQSSAPIASPSNSALTTRFTSFLASILAGHVPKTGLSDKMQTGLTPALVSEIDDSFVSLGQFQKLQFIRQDAVEGYQRYHYNAVFSNGSQPLMFVLDSAGDITGFFKDSSPF